MSNSSKENKNTQKSTDPQEKESFPVLRRKIREEIRNELNEQGEKNPYAICTSSIAKTAGTSERSEWSDAEKQRYDDCIEDVKAKQEGEEKLKQEKMKDIQKMDTTNLSDKELIEFANTLTYYDRQDEDLPELDSVEDAIRAIEEPGGQRVIQNANGNYDVVERYADPKAPLEESGNGTEGEEKLKTTNLSDKELIEEKLKTTNLSDKELIDFVNILTHYERQDEDIPEVDNVEDAIRGIELDGDQRVIQNANGNYDVVERYADPKAPLEESGNGTKGGAELYTDLRKRGNSPEESALMLIKLAEVANSGEYDKINDVNDLKDQKPQTLSEEEIEDAKKDMINTYEEVLKESVLKNATVLKK